VSQHNKLFARGHDGKAASLFAIDANAFGKIHTLLSKVFEFMPDRVAAFPSHLSKI
jgi:hypothetical protein